MSEPVQTFVEHDGLRLAVLDWGSDAADAEPLLLLHPTGFCAGFFAPLAERVRDRYRPIGIDLRGHGASDTPRARPEGFEFARMAGDVLAVLDALGIDRAVALGESLGGGVGVLVDAARPGVLRRLLLCEAIAFDGAAMGVTGTGSPRAGGNFMADNARKRRAVWADRPTVRASYASRPPLSVLAPEFLDAYVEWGFVDRPDGQVELACTPDDEAVTFEMASAPRGAPAAWHHLASLSCPATVVRGEASNLPAAWFDAQAERAGCPIVTVTGSHFFLQEDAARAEALVREHLA
jgi:pimeloyl-ACP methyl ester carboxylesterase